jgi:protein-tyrosine phosphatase
VSDVEKGDRVVRLGFILRVGCQSERPAYHAGVQHLRTPRWLPLDGAVNARAVVSGVLLRADNLQSLSPADMHRLVEDERLEVVIDLRTHNEVRLEGPGPLTAHPAVRIEHRSLYPDSGGSTDLDAAVKPWGREGEAEIPGESAVVCAYVSYLHRRPDSIVDAVRTIACAEGAVLVHCAAGKDRTGVVVALALDAAGVDRRLIVADYVATAERVEAILRRLVQSPTYRRELEGSDPRVHRPVAETMERLLALVDERLGGSAEWLRTHGLRADELDRLTRRVSERRSAAA